MIGAKAYVNTDGMAWLIVEHKRRDVTLKGVREAGKVLRSEAKARAPKRPGSGALKLAQRVLAKKGRKGTTTSFAVQGAIKRFERMVTLPGRTKPIRVVPAFYDHLVQGGTKPHSLGKVIFELQEYKVPGKIAYKTKSVRIGQKPGRRHPGARANPYRKQAWDSVKEFAADVALKAMEIEERKLLAAAMTKLGLPALAGV